MLLNELSIEISLDETHIGTRPNVYACCRRVQLKVGEASDLKSCIVKKLSIEIFLDETHISTRAYVSKILVVECN